MARTDVHHETRKQELVAVATQVFARSGFAGTTNKRLAEAMRATTGRDFTPALIYHYFPEGKLQLFGAVMRQYQPLQTLGQELTAALDTPPEVFFRAAARAYLRALATPATSQLARIVFTEGPRHPELMGELLAHVAPRVFLPFFTYLTQQTTLGQLRPINPFAALVQFFGPLLVRALASEAIGATATPFPLPDDDAMVESHVQTFLHGLAIAAVADGDDAGDDGDGTTVSPAS